MPRPTQPKTPLLALIAIAGSLAALPALAASSASSASSDASSTSVGSSSTSFEKSSNSSSGGNKVAEGDYRVVRVAAADDGRLRLTLAATDGQREGFTLVLPAETAVAAGAAREGAVITARSHDYGWQFARAGARDPFFLVVHDERHRELATRPVTI